jgi:hypothetical protein
MARVLVSVVYVLEHQAIELFGDNFLLGSFLLCFWAGHLVTWPLGLSVWGFERVGNRGFF